MRSKFSWGENCTGLRYKLRNCLGGGARGDAHDICIMWVIMVTNDSLFFYCIPYYFLQLQLHIWTKDTKNVKSSKLAFLVCRRFLISFRFYKHLYKHKDQSQLLITIAVCLENVKWLECIRGKVAILTCFHCAHFWQHFSHSLFPLSKFVQLLRLLPTNSKFSR